MESKPATNAIAPPMVSQNMTTPSAMLTPSTTSRSRLPAARPRAMAFSGRTGSTQGVKLSSMPPSAAVKSSSASPSPPSGLNRSVRPKTLTAMSPVAEAPAALRAMSKPAGSKPAKSAGSAGAVLLPPPSAISIGTWTATDSGG